MTTIKAEPGYYVLSLNESDEGRMILTKHPVIAFDIFRHPNNGHCEMYPITPGIHHDSTLLTPDGMVYVKNCIPVDLETYIECLNSESSDTIEFHVSMES